MLKKEAMPFEKSEAEPNFDDNCPRRDFISNESPLNKALTSHSFCNLTPPNPTYSPSAKTNLPELQQLLHKKPSFLFNKSTIRRRRRRTRPSFSFLFFTKEIHQNDDFKAPKCQKQSPEITHLCS